MASCRIPAATRLREAESAYHQLMSGTAVVEVVDSNGDRVRFQAANREKLYLYIAELRAEIGTGTAPVTRGPVGFLF